MAPTSGITGNRIVLWSVLFALGVGVDGTLRVSVGTWLFLVGFGGFLCTCFGLRIDGAGRHRSRMFVGLLAGLFVATVFFAVGGWWHAHRVHMLRDDLDEYIEAGPVLIRGIVSRLPETDDDRTHYVVRLTDVAGVGGGRSPRVRLTVFGPSRFRYGDELEVRAELRRPEPRTNPGGFDYRAHLLRQGVTATAFVRYPRHVSRLRGGRGNVIVHLAARMREVMTEGLFAAVPDSTARLLAGLALGDRRSLPPSTEETFRRAGVSHLLAVSGMHVGLVGIALDRLLRSLRTPRTVHVLIGGAAIWTYVLATGARPSAVRAGLLGTVALFSLNDRGGGPDAGAALASAGLLLLVHNPLLLFEIGFQLSFAASGGIVLAFQPLMKVLRPLPKPLRTLVALGIAAHVGVVPLLARTFPQLSTTGIVAGVLAAPFVGILIPAAFVIPLLYRIVPFAIPPVASAVHWLTGLFVAALDVLASLPWSYISVPRPTWMFVAATWAMAVLWAKGTAWPPIYRRRFGAVCLLLFVGSWTAGPLGRTAALEVTVLDVGQGDAVFIRTPSGTSALIDGGGRFQPEGEERQSNPGTEVIIPFLRHSNVPAVDVIVNTHPHEDHLQGLIPVLAEYDVRLAVDSGQPAFSPSWRTYLALVQEKAIQRHEARAGDVLWLDENTRLEMLHPEEHMDGTRSDFNNNSVVAKLVHGDATMLLTGDIEEEAQLALLGRKEALQADVVKVPHHGSRLALVTAFYEQVGADIAVIPVGRNNHGHPSDEVISTLHRLGTAVYRNDVHGAVRLTTRGQGWRVQAFRER